MKRGLLLLLLCVLLGAAIAAATLSRRRPAAPIGSCGRQQGRLPRIRPDYTGTVIPPNIAPLNFVVQEPGTHYHVEISGLDGATIRISSRSPSIVIPIREWRELLRANRGQQISCNVYVRSADGSWTGFDSITNTVAEEDIDGHLVYRLIRPLYNFWRDVGVYQRNLSNFDESVVVHGRAISNACVNCHTFCDGRTDKMTLGVRSAVHGGSAVIAYDGRATALDTKFGYTSWHPNGRLVAYSLNKVRQFFHAGGVEVRDVVDLDSDLVYYEIGSRKVKTTPGISNPDRLETYPSWSPDGRYLYFCSAPILWSERNRVPPENYDQVRYDLMRIPYDPDSDTWGEPETLLSAEEVGKSILLPRVSPDGRFVLLCMCDYGCFPIYQPSSDLYLMNVETGEYWRLGINSDERSESWHSWSSNGRWFVFSSKRRDGLFTRSYIAYFDETGRAHKPFILPQEDPTFYDSFLKTYTVPELVTEPVRVSAKALAEAACSEAKLAVEMPNISMTAKQGRQAPAQPSAAS
ncbi:MAG: hypothetical protein ACE5O2_11405, partial [Armatimonadota bacterium]